MPSSSGPRCDMTSHIRRSSPGLTRVSLRSSKIPAIPHISDTPCQEQVRFPQTERAANPPCDPATRISRPPLTAKQVFCSAKSRSCLGPLQIAPAGNVLFASIETRHRISRIRSSTSQLCQRRENYEQLLQSDICKHEELGAAT